MKPRGQLQKENDLKFLQMLKEHKMESKSISDHGLYEMLQEYMVENEILRQVGALLVDQDWGQFLINQFQFLAIPFDSIPFSNNFL